MKKYLAQSVAMIALVLTTLPAAAQTAGDIGPDEIVVTARKRQESILKVPVVTTVLTQRQLEQSQVTTISNIATLTPGIILGAAALEIGTQVSIRGVGTNAQSPAIDQSVSLNIDGLQLTQGSAYSVGLFDMQQVEVLKGPQALFFGKNSPGGVISIRTADPSDKLEVVGRIGHEFNARETRGELILSGPVSDTLGLRLATMYSHLGGVFKNNAVAIPALGAVDPANRFGRTNTLYVRGTAVYKGDNGFSARLKLNYTRDRNRGGVPFQLVSCPDGQGPQLGLDFYALGEDCKANKTLGIVDMNPAFYGGSLTNNGVPFTNIGQRFGTLEWNYDFEQMTFTSVTGYYRQKTDALLNGFLVGAGGPAIAADKSFRRRDFTQEVRLNSDFSGPINFTTGGFYQNGKVSNRIVINGNSAYLFPPNLQDGSHKMKIRSISAFGQLRYKPVEVLEVSGGVRWTSEKRSDDAASVDIFGAFGPAGATVNPIVPKIKTSNWSPELTVTYTPTDDLTLFGSLKRGYKSGSFDILTAINPGDDNSFGDEKVTGGEIGLKTRLDDRQLNINIAGYLYKYKGLQVGSAVPVTTPVPVFRVLNAGSAKIYGVDFDMTYRPNAVPGLVTRAAVNWNHARFTKFLNAPCWGGQTIAEGCNGQFSTATGLFTSQDLSGSRLVRAPDWQLNLGFSYEMPAGDSMKLVFGADGQYSSKYLGFLGRRSDFFQNAHAKINANVALRSANDGWELGMIFNNITNKYTRGNCVPESYGGNGVLAPSVTGAAARGANGIDELICAVDRGREVWLRLTIRPADLFR